MSVYAKAKVIANKRYKATKSSVFIPTVCFIDQQGHEVNVEARLSGAGSPSSQKYKVGELLAIIYDPANPQNLIVDNWYGRFFYTFKKAAPATLIVIVAGIIWMFTI